MLIDEGWDDDMHLFCVFVWRRWLAPIWMRKGVHGTHLPRRIPLSLSVCLDVMKGHRRRVSDAGAEVDVISRPEHG